MPLKKPEGTSVKTKTPRERLSLPLTPHLTKAVQALAGAFKRSQAEVLADLIRLAAPGLTLNLGELQAAYEAAQREALAGVLIQEGSVRGVYGNDPGD